MLLESQRGEKRGWLGSAGLNMSEFICWNIQIHHTPQFTIGKDTLRAGRSYIYIYVCIYSSGYFFIYSCSLIYSLCAHSFLHIPSSPLKGGRRHQGVSPSIYFPTSIQRNPTCTPQELGRRAVAARPEASTRGKMDKRWDTSDVARPGSEAQEMAWGGPSNHRWGVCQTWVWALTGLNNP